MNISKSEIDALIRLLDDQDTDVFEHIEQRFLSIGRPAIPILEEAWEGSFDPFMQERIENLIHKIQFDGLKDELVEWSISEGAHKYEHAQHSLLKGAMLIARYQYPDLDEDKVMQTLNLIRRSIWLELNNNLTALERIKVMNQIFFGEFGFMGNTTNYHAPQNSYLNTVLESRKGNPLLLAVIYSYVAQCNDIPVFGVNLPDHFILAYEDAEISAHATLNYPAIHVLFYINAFSKGTIFNSEEIDNFLRQLKLNADPSYFKPCINLHIIQRMLRNLIFAYHKVGDRDKGDELQSLLNAISKANK